MIHQSIQDKLLQRFPLIAELPAKARQALFSQAIAHRVPAGAMLFAAGNPCTGFPLILDGTVSVVKASSQGREILLYRIVPGESCILSSGCLLGQCDYSASAIAETEVTLLNMPANVFQELLLASVPFRQFVFGLLGARLSEVIELVEEIAFHRVDERLARLLIHRGPVVSASHQDLADELGSAREVISRLLGSFERRGWVNLERERITVVDPKSLFAAFQG